MDQLNLTFPPPPPPPDPGFVTIYLPKFFPMFFDCYFCGKKFSEYHPEQAAVEIAEDATPRENGKRTGTWHTAHESCIAKHFGFRREDDKKWERIVIEHACGEVTYLDPDTFHPIGAVNASEHRPQS
jgi:hypothetical protein